MLAEAQRIKAAALAAALEALTDSHARILARELRAVLENVQERDELVDEPPSRDVAERCTTSHDVTPVAPPPPASSGRALSMTPDAIRARRRRQAAAGRVVDERQAVLPFGATPVATAVATGRDRSASLSDLCDQKILRNQREAAVGRSVATGVHLEPKAIPAEAADIAREVRPELDAELVARSWAKFARQKAGKFRDEPRMLAAWQGWIERERVASGVPPADPPPPPPSPPSGPRAVHRESTELFAEHDRHEHDAAPPELAAELARKALEELGGRRRRTRDVAPRSTDVAGSREDLELAPPCPVDVARERARIGLMALELDEDLGMLLGPPLARGMPLRPRPEPRAMSA